MADKCCSKCKFAQGPVRRSLNLTADQYLCRRYPPRETHPEWGSPHPLVLCSGWCGEFAAGTPAPLETP